MASTITREKIRQHKWLLREDGKYECADCGEVVTKHSLSVMENISKDVKLSPCKGVENKKLDKKDLAKPLIRQKIKELFAKAKLVSFEQIKPFMGDDAEQFWTGVETEQESMLEFLERNGFEIIECHKKGDKFQSEIYVNFDRFAEDLPNPEPIVYLSEPVKELLEIHSIKQMSIELAKKTGKQGINISRYGKDGFKLSFSGELRQDYDELKENVLAKLGKEMNLEFSVDGS